MVGNWNIGNRRILKSVKDTNALEAVSSFPSRIYTANVDIDTTAGTLVTINTFNAPAQHQCIRMRDLRFAQNKRLPENGQFTGTHRDDSLRKGFFPGIAFHSVDP